MGELSVTHVSRPVVRRVTKIGILTAAPCAVERAAFCSNLLYYQPFVTLESGFICGFEGLLRWHHPQRGMVAPAEFIPRAEEIGLIVPIGEWVLHQACAEAAAWPDDLKVAVNLSPVQFSLRREASSAAAAV